METMISTVQANISMLAHSKENAEIFREGMTSFEEMEQSDQSQYMMLVSAIFSGLDTLYWSYKQGNIDQELWDRECNVMRMYLSSDGGRAVWRFNAQRGLYTESFKSFVENELETDLGLATNRSQ